MSLEEVMAFYTSPYSNASTTSACQYVQYCKKVYFTLQIKINVSKHFNTRGFNTLKYTQEEHY